VRPKKSVTIYFRRLFEIIAVSDSRVPAIFQRAPPPRAKKNRIAPGAGCRVAKKNRFSGNALGESRKTLTEIVITHGSKNCFILVYRHIVNKRVFGYIIFVRFVEIFWIGFYPLWYSYFFLLDIIASRIFRAKFFKQLFCRAAKRRHIKWFCYCSFLHWHWNSFLHWHHDSFLNRVNGICVFVDAYFFFCGAFLFHAKIPERNGI
jgi:hypothetical protein